MLQVHGLNSRGTMNSRMLCNMCQTLPGRHTSSHERAQNLTHTSCPIKPCINPTQSYQKPTSSIMDTR